MFSSMTIKQRLMMFVALVCGLQLFVAGFVFIQLVSIEDHIKGVAHRDIPVIASLSKATEHQLEQRIAYNKAFRFAVDVEHNPQAKEDYAKEKSHYFEVGEKIEKEWIEIENQFINAIEEGSLKEQEEFQSAKNQLSDIVIKHQKWNVRTQDIFIMLESGRFFDAEKTDHALAVIAETTTKKIEGLLEEVEHFTENAVIEIEHQAKMLENVVLLTAFAAVFIASLISMFILKSIYEGLKKVSDALARQASGDFSQKVEVEDVGIIGELQKSMERARKNTNEMIAKVADDVNHSVHELNKASQAVKSNSDAQSLEIIQVATAVNEMSATAQEIANNASLTQDATENASRQSGESLRVNEEAMCQMNQLIESLTQSSAALSELEKNSTNIASVLDVIKGIAEQTNLLALNAAIEAARAGEQGRGFAVVADEVRSLAQRTHDSTSEIETMIAQLSSVTKDAVETMRKSCDMGDKTIELSSQSANYLSQASDATKKVTEMNLQVASAADQQSGVVEEVNINVNRISEMAEESASEVAHLVSAMDKLNIITSSLQSSVGKAS